MKRVGYSEGEKSVHGAFQRHGVNRREVLLAGSAAALSAALHPLAGDAAQEATPAAPWSYTDVLGNTVTLPQRPTRIAAVIQVGAALWDFGIETPTIFGWTASNHADGDHPAWGSVDVDAVQIVSSSDGDIDLEALLLAKPDLIVTWVWDKNVPGETHVSLPPKLLAQAAQIAPVIAINQGDANDIELVRIEEFARALGADLESAELTAQRAAYAERIAEVQQIAQEKPDVSVLFASYGSEQTIYVAGPDFVGDVGQLRTLGVKIANDGSPTSRTYWEELSLEQALYYPSDVVYIDQYGEWKTLEELRQHPTISQHPAIKAGQAGPWARDLPLSYVGLTEFLDATLAQLRDAEKVS